MTTQNKTSNWVYVVSLSHDKAGNSNLSYIDVVERKGKYYHPFGTNGWPKDAPNYIAFRYDGQLQSIHHIDDYDVTKNMHTFIPEIPDEEWEPHFIYTLGPAIKPSKIVKNGSGVRRAARVWAMLDLLLTSDTITEARDISYKRSEE